MLTRAEATIRMELFRALGNPIRLQLLDLLKAGERNVDQLVQATGSSQPAVSRHLTVLRKAGLISSHRVGINVVYQIEAQSVFNVLNTAAEILRADTRRRSRLLP